MPRTFFEITNSESFYGTSMVNCGNPVIGAAIVSDNDDDDSDRRLLFEDNHKSNEKGLLVENDDKGENRRVLDEEKSRYEIVCENMTLHNSVSGLFLKDMSAKNQFLEVIMSFKLDNIALPFLSRFWLILDFEELSVNVDMHTVKAIDTVNGTVFETE